MCKLSYQTRPPKGTDAGELQLWLRPELAAHIRGCGARPLLSEPWYYSALFIHILSTLFTFASQSDQPANAASAGAPALARALQLASWLACDSNFSSYIYVSVAREGLVLLVEAT